MARGKKLSDAYVELRAEDSKLSGDVKVKATRAAKAFGGQLNNALKALNLDPIDVKADPKTALAAIETTRERLRKMSAEAESVEVRVRTERAITQLDRFRKQLGDVGEEGAEGFAARFGAKIGPLLASTPLSPPLLIAVGVAAAAAAPTLAAAMGAAMIGGAAGTGIVGGAILAARDPRIKAAGADLGTFILGDLEQRSSAFVPVVLDGIADIRAGWISLGPDITRIFSSSRLVDPLVAGAVSGARHVVGGIADAVEKADPVVDAFAASFDRLGDAVGDQFTLLAGDADEAASAVNDLTGTVANLIRVVGGLAHIGANVKGWTDQVDIAIDRGRYWIEDNSNLAEKLRNVGVELDITADGFKAGTAEAEAYRDATLGTADAADFATLKAAGMTDAQIAAADASGRYRLMTDEAKAATDRAGASWQNNVQSVEEFTRRLESLNGVMSEAVTGNISAERSQIRLEEAIDRATEAAKRNGDGIDRNHPKQRANREALLGIADAALQAAQDIFANTKSHDLAAVATERGRVKFLEAANAMGVERGEALRLANQLFGIPLERNTKAEFTGDDKGVADWKKTLSGIPRNIFIKAHFDLINDREVAMALRLGRLEAGGPVDGEGPKGKDSQLILAAPGEHMLTAAEVDRMGGHGAVFAFRRQLMSFGASAATGSTTGAPGATTMQTRVMDSGGWIMPGWNPPVWNGTGRPEAVTTAASMDALVSELRALRRDSAWTLAKVVEAVEQVAPGVGRAINGVGQTLALRGRTGAWPQST